MFKFGANYFLHYVHCNNIYKIHAGSILHTGGLHAVRGPRDA
jgi:hypothetical protein